MGHCKYIKQAPGRSNLWVGGRPPHHYFPLASTGSLIRPSRLSRIAQLDQRTALPDQCLHSAEADVRPPRRKAEFDPYATLAIRAGKRSHNPNFISFLDQGPTIGCQLDREYFQRPRRAPRLLPSGADRHDLISEGCETAVRRPEPTGLIDVAAVDHQGVGVGAPPAVARIALDRP